MTQHRAGRDRSQALQAVVIGAVLCLLIVALVVWGARDQEDGGSSAIAPALGSTTATPGPGATTTIGPPLSAPRPQPVRPGGVIRPEPEGPELVEPGTGRVGSGLVLGPLAEVDAPRGVPVEGTVTISVANLPNRTSSGGFASSVRSLTADGQDFVCLNEVSGRSLEGIEGLAPGYDAYRDPQPDRSRGGSQSMNNVVMWRTDRWTLVDAGRIKLVDDDRGFHGGKPFTWDRYATWAMLQRKDGALVSVVSTHMMTNPGKFPRTHGGSGSRVGKYAHGMDVLRASVATLAEHGPVLVGGDMNSHAGQGAWTAAAKMTASGYGYVKDRGVMYLFYPGGAEVVSHRQVGVASDHPAIVTTLDLNGLGPS